MQINVISLKSPIVKTMSHNFNDNTIETNNENNAFPTIQNA